MTHHPIVRLACIVSAGVAIAACNATVVGGGGVGGGTGGGGDEEGGEDVGGSGGGAPAVVTTGGPSTGTGPSSTGSGAPVAEDGGVVIPDGEDDVHVLLGNFAQTCDAPQTEPPCAAGAWWLATIRMKTGHLTPGRYPLNTGETAIDLHERFDDCSGEGFAGWDGEPAYLTVDAVDAARVSLTIEGAYDGVDGAWDVPLCGVALP